MTVSDLFGQVYMQGEIKVVYFEENGCERIEIELERAEDLEIEYMYCDDGILYIEVELDN